MSAYCQDHGSYCIPVTDSPDRFCMKYAIPEGSSCGATVADVMTKDPQDIGYCQYPLKCLDGTCVQCTASIGEVCDDTMFPELFPQACCEGTCTPVPVSNRSSICMQHDIGFGEACGDSAAEGYLGYCKDGLSCTDGICQTTPDTCLAAGEACWDPAQNVMTGSCCSGQVCDGGYPFAPPTATYTCKTLLTTTVAP